LLLKREEERRWEGRDKRKKIDEKMNMVRWEDRERKEEMRGER
jgi:hypothetical protein